MEVSGIHARLAVAADCPVARVADRLDVIAFVPGRAEGAPQVVVDDAPSALDGEPVEPVVWRADGVVCRLDADGCGSGCPACDPGGLPVAPYAIRWRDGWMLLELAARDGEEVRAVVSALREAGHDVELRRVTRDAVGDRAGGTATVDLSALTERQREVAVAAVERGYFDPCGPSAAVLADELGISKSTLSEHLRAVQRELVRQLFGDAASATT
jgi:hypothetical protein